MTFLRSSWTGRSVVSSATNTARSQISTSGLHLTRVSALRGVALQASARRLPRAQASELTAFPHAGGTSAGL
jgi:hypothetical protein